MVPQKFLFNAAEKVLGQVYTLLQEKYKSYSSFQDDLEELESDLSAILAVLLDAEKQQEKSNSVKDWLEKLQDALHDAEDLLDDLNAEALRQKVDAELPFVTVVRNFFFLSGMDDRIKKIQKKIKAIADQRSRLHLQQQGNGATVPLSQKEHPRPSLRVTEIVGRDEDKNAVIELLIGSNKSDESLCVVPIVAMGGLGKTALAKLVFDDDRIKNGGFDLASWVEVSDDLNPERIGQKIIRSVKGSEYNAPYGELLPCLREIVSGKNFLLVLDDVWNGNRVQWVDLKDLLGNGAKGSRIVVTTRDKNTASIMGKDSVYNLGPLPFNWCWSLFEKWASGEEESDQDPHLAEIGQDIVRRCGGVPLAIRTVGSALSRNTQESYWQSVKDCDTWGMDHMPQTEDDILPVLKLSYDQLPPHLKECFAYCSLLPKGQQFDKEDLIQLWISQGFIHSSDGHQHLEDVGSWYFNELVSRSIFDVVRENHKNEIVKCRMHDLFHDLAKTVAETEYSTVKTTNMSNSIRHVSFWGRGLTEDPRSFLTLPKLRTLLLSTNLGNSSIPLLDILLSGSTYLRMLDLSNSGIKYLPNCIGYVKHLKYLNLNGNSELRSLPDSICSLHSLQTLKLSGCRKISTFPRKFNHLVSLRYLIISIPSMFGHELARLTTLQSLTIEHSRNLVSLYEVTKNLTVLRTLRIQNCGKLTSLPQSLENCTALENLEVVNCPNMRSLEVRMQGLSTFRSLTIKGLSKLVNLPEKPECYSSTLRFLFITDCLSLITLPECLGNLSSLMHIHIMYCPNLHNLPNGFCQITAPRVLKIEGCPLLSTRC